MTNNFVDNNQHINSENLMVVDNFSSLNRKFTVQIRSLEKHVQPVDFCRDGNFARVIPLRPAAS